jgi:hypothetical protein
MTGTLPGLAQDVFERFITTEYTTVDARQQPITWPVTPYYQRGGPTIDVTTGLGYPKKADDARRNPRVSLLFSDPNGSGLETAAQILVQGTARVDEDDLEANRERYARESVIKLPATKKMHPPEFVQRRLQWYYARIYVEVRPERVLIWPDGNFAVAPEVHDARLEEVRSGHSEEPPEPHEPVAGGGVAWDARIDELGGTYPTAVLSWVGPDGFPLSVRVPVAVDRAAHRIELGETPEALPLIEGRACLAAHAHAPNFTWQRNFQVRGDLVRDEDGWALIPHKLIGGFEIPKGIGRFQDVARNHWRFRRTAKRRLANP